MRNAGPRARRSSAHLDLLARLDVKARDGDVHALHLVAEGVTHRKQRRALVKPVVHLDLL